VTKLQYGVASHAALEERRYPGRFATSPTLWLFAWRWPMGQMQMKIVGKF
jgi:hypothetical protein